ncbi:hypothetical protein ABIA14_005098 [Sinorhizobium fredii]
MVKRIVQSSTPGMSRRTLKTAETKKQTAVEPVPSRITNDDWVRKH